MQSVNLGGSGLKVSRIILGCMTYGASSWRPWVLDEDASRPLIRQALEAGITTFDTADTYGFGASEDVVGRALKDFGRRDEIVIATKVCRPMSKKANDRGLSRKHIVASIDASLKRLRTDYVDLYQIHRYDLVTPIEETLEALNDVVRAGKALYIGASNIYAWQHASMLYTSKMNGWAKFVSMQIQYNAVYREEEREMLPLCRDQLTGVICWSPLARGFVVAGRDRAARGDTVRSRSDPAADQFYAQESDEAVVEAISEVARTRGLPNAQIALAWLLAKPGVTAPIIGASKAAHIEDAIAALSVQLTPEEIAAIDAPYAPKAFLDHG